MITACGALFYAQETKRYLYLLRFGARYSSTWGLVGGTVEPGETVIKALTREITEELGTLPEIKKFIPLETFTSSDSQFQFETFVCIVEREFLPKLNHEHIGYAWVDHTAGKQLKLHPGLWQTLTFDVVREKLQTIVDIF